MDSEIVYLTNSEDEIDQVIDMFHKKAIEFQIESQSNSPLSMLSTSNLSPTSFHKYKVIVSKDMVNVALAELSEIFKQGTTDQLLEEDDEKDSIDEVEPISKPRINVEIIRSVFLLVLLGHISRYLLKVNTIENRKQKLAMKIFGAVWTCWMLLLYYLMNNGIVEFGYAIIFSIILFSIVQTIINLLDYVISKEKLMRKTGFVFLVIALAFRIGVALYSRFFS